jgi:hypothetical protein
VLVVAEPTSKVRFGGLGAGCWIGVSIEKVTLLRRVAVTSFHLCVSYSWSRGWNNQDMICGDGSEMKLVQFDDKLIVVLCEDMQIATAYAEAPVLGPICVALVCT